MDKLKTLYPDFPSAQYAHDLESHILYKHDENQFSGAISPYCVACTLYPFLSSGIRDLGGLSAAPKNLKSFCGILCNAIFAISSQFAGAVAVSEALLYFTYFCKKEWGEDFYKNLDLITNQTLVDKGLQAPRTILSEIHQYWQQIVYTINQPAAARGFQSAFVNFSYFDRYFFEGMFGNFYFPDGTQPDWESLNVIQQEFMKWFNEERKTKEILTFPVESFSLLYKDGKFLDDESFKFVCDEYERGHSFFTYISDTVDSLSSCCFDKDTRIMYSVRGSSSFEKCVSIEDAYNKDCDKEIEVLGFNPFTKERKWVTGKFVKAISSELYRISFKDRAEWTTMTATADHIFPMMTNNGYVVNVYAKDLLVGSKLVADRAQWDIEESDSSDMVTVEISSIEKIEKPTDVYCIELDNHNSPYFVLANGIITHNCRLKNKLQTREFNFTLGNIGVE